jgi:hypothetical protein
VITESRVDSGSTLMGQAHQVAANADALVYKGGNDGFRPSRSDIAPTENVSVAGLI